MGHSPPKKQIHLFTAKYPGIVCHYGSMCTIRRGKKPFSKLSHTTWNAIFLTGKKDTNLEKASNNTRIAMLPCCERISGLIKSINYLSVGPETGLSKCKPTRVFWASFTLWQIFLPISWVSRNYWQSCEVF